MKVTAKGQASPKGQSTRQRLLKAALAELEKYGMDLELKNVAKRAKLSEGITYYHFKSKAGLLQALSELFYEQLDEGVNLAIFEGKTWRERERLRVEAMVSLFYENPLAMMLITQEKAGSSLLADRSRLERLYNLGEKNVQAAQATGEISSRLNPRLLVAMMLAAAMEGVKVALTCDPKLSLKEAKQQVWSFIERASGAV